MRLTLRARQALAVLVTAGALLSGAAVRGDEPSGLPPGTEAAQGVPPLVPAPEVAADPARLSAWIGALTAAGRAAPGTRRAAECLLSAAAQQEACDTGDGAARAAARGLYAEAVNAAPAADPLAGLAALRVVRLALDVGEVERARSAAAWLEAWGARPRGVDLDATDLRRFELLDRLMRTTFPLDAAEALAGLGRYAAAAARLLPLHQDPPPDLPLPVALIDERMALYEHRAGNASRARNAMAWAFERSRNPAQRARVGFWLLHQQQGLLDAAGALRPGTELAGSALCGAGFVSALRLLLGQLDGNPYAVEHLLALGSAAARAGCDASADACYDLAEREPALAARARSEPLLLEGLVARVPVLLRLGRPEDAEDLLRRLESLGGRTPRLADALRVRLKVARDEAAAASTGPAEQAPAPDAGPPEARDAPAGLREPGLREPGLREPGRLDLPRRDPGPVERARAAPAAQGGAARPLPWAGLLAVAALLLLALLLARRARR